jgi:hypothetical protein
VDFIPRQLNFHCPSPDSKAYKLIIKWRFLFRYANGDSDAVTW